MESCSYADQYHDIVYTTIGRVEEIGLMMTSSNENIFLLTGPLCGEFTGHQWMPPSQRPVTRSIDVFFDLRLNKWLSKQSICRWFEMQSRPLWCHCNVKLQKKHPTSCPHGRAMGSLPSVFRIILIVLPRGLRLYYDLAHQCWVWKLMLGVPRSYLYLTHTHDDIIL